MRSLLAKSALIGATLTGAACGLSDEGALPLDVQDPTTLKTPSGALARYRGAVGTFPAALEGVVRTGGILTDELVALPLTLGTAGPYTSLDNRQSPAFGPARLHRLRAQAREARGFLATYAADSSPALRGHLYALEAYAEIYLADLFCSGIPLSTVQFDGNYTLAAGSTTSEVYRHAIALFDTALTLTADSARFQHLAEVGRGRAFLALGLYGAASTAVTLVPDDYRYQISFPFFPSNAVPATLPDSAALVWFAITGSSANRAGAPSMGNEEGGAGLDYQTSADPRTLPWTVTNRTDPQGNRLLFPRKYTPNGAGGAPTSPVAFTPASGIEARLIGAEAALQNGDAAWLITLNALRTDGTFDTRPNATDPSKTDTLWRAGSGGVGGLRPFDDPGSDSAQVSLLFRERAFWLYLSGYRQGDLRRLVRQYLRNPQTLYPSGDSYRGGDGMYGSEIVVPAPEEERTLNPLYTGCFHRNA